MTLRIVRGMKTDPLAPESFAISQTRPDDWLIRIVKLVPAEAIALYGVGSALVLAGADEHSNLGLFGLAAACLLVTILFRIKATRNQITGKVQWFAIVISTVSFALWLMALKPPVGLVELGVYPSLLAVVWGTTVPLVYRGDPA